MTDDIRSSRGVGGVASTRGSSASSGTAKTDIVVGIDGSPGSESALRWAIDEAVRRGARIRAVLGSCAGEQPPTVRRSAEAVAGPHDEEALAWAASQILHEELDAVPIPTGLDIVEEVVDASGTEALLTSGRDAAMIVVGTRGRGLLHRLRIGSVSASVAVHSPVPVVVARTRRPSDDAEAGRVDSSDSEPTGSAGQAPTGSAPETEADAVHPVVVGVDGSPNSLAALRWAASEAALRGAPLHVVHAWLAAIPLPFAESSAEILPALEDQARHVLDESIEAALGTSETTDTRKVREIDVHKLLVAASATRALLDASRDADLLVVGARGKGGFAELLLGSVSHQTMLHSAAPVAIVRDV
ncbi:Nucleotide-binding universal stress protein, UspA family [Parafrankia irregularis]|uniref:Nucleotide-binding universal stress protein, UspA family n=1 Tax=Parafrankia irregularis TaxID=795642 RepID=A0A0S4QS26_9ACTN|nr:MULTISPECIES: universal stress protein [Parafrankia]MBE3204403.1 universal stress protein [Parafrankia sp. CH37]CUU57672.1 Nucleotide-binding universal stress protein, UspA family [Parafrankia irregularis]